MFKKQINNLKTETTEEFLARGGQITKIVEGDSYKRKTRKSGKIDAQALLDAANCPEQEESIINFLENQGIKVQR